jgi:lipopolysaccharide/colanic/teichoic acid biosynthesis glycosyltransferase
VSVSWSNDTTTAAPIAAAPARREPVVPAQRTEIRGWERTKRAIDIVGAAALLVVLLPLLLLVALAIRLDSRGPAIFRQERLGRHMRSFTVLKFRTMVQGAPAELHERYIARLMSGELDEAEVKKLTHDPRVTRVGRFLRKTSLDELPQLLNVVTGQMSLVGPRPAIEYELGHYDAVHYDRFLVRPGLTGLWQVSGRSGIGFREMLELDRRYALDHGPALDARILLTTPVALVRKPAA